MDAAASTLGIRRRIGYSIAGVLTGDFFLLILFSLIAKTWEQPASYFWRASSFILDFSFFGLLVVGVPVVLLFNTAALARLKWHVEVLIGVLLGFISMLLLFAIFGEHLPKHSWGFAYFWLFAALVSTVAFSIYSALVRWALQRREIERALEVKDEPLRILRPMTRIDINDAVPEEKRADRASPDLATSDIASLRSFAESFRAEPGPERPLDIYNSEWLNTLEPTDPRRLTSEGSRPPGSKPS